MLEVELIADYLMENSYVSSEKDAYEFIPCMSDEWLSLVLEEVLNEETYSLYNVISEMRKEDKVKGKKKTPMYVTVQGKTKLEKSPEGKWEKSTPTHTAPNPDVVLRRARQGMPMDPAKAFASHRAFLSNPKSQVRHPHGGSELGVPAGYARGKKETKGAKTDETYTTAERLRQRLDKQRRDKSSAARYGIGGEKFKKSDLVSKYPKLNLPA